MNTCTMMAEDKIPIAIDDATEKMKSWDATEDEVKAATLGGVVPKLASQQAVIQQAQQQAASQQAAVQQAQQQAVSQQAAVQRPQQQAVSQQAAVQQAQLQQDQ